MSMDIEAGGALITAGLLAGEIDGNTQDSHPKAEHQTICANCATPLTGAFCHGCGQKAHVHRSVLHLGEEFLHGILHFDTKAWRTLPMLVFKPGQLTRRYLDGQRTRYVSPLALFLFMMFFMFFVGSYTNGGVGKSDKVRVGIAELQDDLAKNRSRLADAQAALEKGVASGKDQQALAEEVADARGAVSQSEKSVRMFGKAAALAATTGIEAAPDEDAATEESDDVGFKTDIAALDEAFKKANKNPELTKYKLKSTATKFTFLLVPISMPFLWLLFFWKRGVTMYDHAVFALYSLSFMALLFVVLFLLKFAGLKSAVVWLIFLAPPLHMFSQLRGTYNLGFGATLWRTFSLLCIALTVFILYMVLILVLTVG
jgi:hypothetical protein